MTFLIQMVIVLIIIGAVLYLVKAVLPIDEKIKTVIYVLVVVAVCIWALMWLTGVNVPLPTRGR